MALPRWITPKGNLGIVPELEYYEFPLDAYDASGGTLVYSVVSGHLPLGIQLNKAAGKLQGIPVSELGGDQNVEYRFTIRVVNQDTNGLSDRSFSITVTNVAPPIINPRNVDLGLYFDGTVVNQQLEVIEFSPSAKLTWKVKSGDLPPGLSLTTSGLLYGYIEPIVAAGPSGTPGWDQTPWSELGWDFPLNAISKYFNFSVEVFDGVNYDVSTYKLLVIPQSSIEADSAGITADTTLASGAPITIDTGARHEPIILTTQSDIPPYRQNSYFSFQIAALDLNGDVLQYIIPAKASGAFDEQTIVGNSIPYVASQLVDSYLYAGIFPLASVVETDDNSLTSENVIDLTNLNYSPDTDIKVLGGDETDPSGKNLLWYNGTVNYNTILTVTGATKITGSAGNFITQAMSGANATISNISNTTGTISVSGNTYVGSLTFAGDAYKSKILNLTGTGASITASVGDYIYQASTGANALVTASVISSRSVPVSIITGTDFTTGTGNITVNGVAKAAYPDSVEPISITANVGDIILQPSTGANAVVTANAAGAISVIVEFISGTFSLGNTSVGSGNITINGTSVAAYPVSLVKNAIPGSITANAGDFVTQPSTGANATVVRGGTGVTQLSVIYNAGTFSTVSGNLQVNGTAFTVQPTTVVCNTDITATYNTSNIFRFNSSDASAIAYINGVTTNSVPTAIQAVGVTLHGFAEEGIVGFDEGRFDQGTLNLPEGIALDINSGWLTGKLPAQTVNEILYEFEVDVYKRDYTGYRTSQIYSLTVLGDLNNTINWVTPSDLGTIENGRISDLFVSAVSTKGKTLVYSLKAHGSHRLPQGMELLYNGLLSGRVSFELFSLDMQLDSVVGQTATTFDGRSTTFDNTYTFTVTAHDLDLTVSADRTFTLRVLPRNVVPYENLYLKALTSMDQRLEFQNIINDTSVFPQELIYRNEDPWFGMAKDIKLLFLPGLNPTTLADYAASASTNHYNKRIIFGNVRTARALDSNFNTKYEVVYLEVQDENTNALGHGPADTINVSSLVQTPYYDPAGNSYTIAYPNSFENMDDVMIAGVGYVNKGALPDWMTSKQADGRVLGFTRAIVLAYTVPNASALIAYRYGQKGYNLNNIDFTVDRYQLDNNYSANFDISTMSFITSRETTFDRYPGRSTQFNEAGTVDYAVSIPFDSINNHYKADINALGGLDGIKHFVDGEYLVFAQQEYYRSQGDTGDYNHGWADIEVLWDSSPWAYNTDTSDNDYTDPVPPTNNLNSDTTPGQSWDAASYVPGYDEHLLDPSVPNKRIGIWQINISSEDIVTLTFIQEINYYDKLFVRYGYTYGSANIYYDKIVKTQLGFLKPNYSIIPQQIKLVSTRFDGNGTRFLDNRDKYSVPEEGDKYIKFAKTGVFT